MRSISHVGFYCYNWRVFWRRSLVITSIFITKKDKDTGHKINVHKVQKSQGRSGCWWRRSWRTSLRTEQNSSTATKGFMRNCYWYLVVNNITKSILFVRQAKMEEGSCLNQLLERSTSIPEPPKFHVHGANRRTNSLCREIRTEEQKHMYLNQFVNV